MKNTYNKNHSLTIAINTQFSNINPSLIPHIIDYFRKNSNNYQFDNLQDFNNTTTLANYAYSGFEVNAYGTIIRRYIFNVLCKNCVNNDSDNLQRHYHCKNGNTVILPHYSLSFSYNDYKQYLQIIKDNAINNLKFPKEMLTSNQHIRKSFLNALTYNTIYSDRYRIFQDAFVLGMNRANLEQVLNDLYGNCKPENVYEKLGFTLIDFINSSADKSLFYKGYEILYHCHIFLNQFEKLVLPSINKISLTALNTNGVLKGILRGKDMNNFIKSLSEDKMMSILNTIKLNCKAYSEYHYLYIIKSEAEKRLKEVNQSIEECICKDFPSKDNYVKILNTKEELFTFLNNHAYYIQNTKEIMHTIDEVITSYRRCFIDWNSNYKKYFNQIVKQIKQVNFDSNPLLKKLKNEFETIIVSNNLEDFIQKCDDVFLKNLKNTNDNLNSDITLYKNYLNILNSYSKVLNDHKQNITNIDSTSFISHAVFYLEEFNNNGYNQISPSDINQKFNTMIENNSSFFTDELTIRLKTIFSALPLDQMKHNFSFHNQVISDKKRDYDEILNVLHKNLKQTENVFLNLENLIMIIEKLINDKKNINNINVKIKYDTKIDVLLQNISNTDDVNQIKKYVKMLVNYVERQITSYVDDKHTLSQLYKQFNGCKVLENEKLDKMLENIESVSSSFFIKEYQLLVKNCITNCSSPDYTKIEDMLNKILLEYSAQLMDKIVTLSNHKFSSYYKKEDNLHEIIKNVFSNKCITIYRKCQKRNMKFISLFKEGKKININGEEISFSNVYDYYSQILGLIQSNMYKESSTLAYKLNSIALKQERFKNIYKGHCTVSKKDILQALFFDYLSVNGESIKNDTINLKKGNSDITLKTIFEQRQEQLSEFKNKYNTVCAYIFDQNNGFEYFNVANAFDKVIGFSLLSVNPLEMYMSIMFDKI